MPGHLFIYQSKSSDFSSFFTTNKQNYWNTNWVINHQLWHDDKIPNFHKGIERNINECKEFDKMLHIKNTKVT
jgi:hypothetical protein